MEPVPLDEISADLTFRLREPGDVSGLAVSMGRLGQLEPVDLRPLPPGAADGEGKRWQVVAGFRRMEAVRLLQRERVLARVHEKLPDEDAWALALAAPLFGEPWSAADLETLAAKVRAHLPWAEATLAAIRKRVSARPERAAPATATATAPANAPVAAPAAAQAPEAWLRQLALRAYELNRELADACERWPSLPPDGRVHVLTQVRYLARLLPLLEKEPK